MALIVDIRINDRVVDRIAATRIETNPDGNHRYRIERADLDRYEVRDLGTVVHAYRDGAARLAAIICAEVAARDEDARRSDGNDRLVYRDVTARGSADGIDRSEGGGKAATSG